LDYKLKISLRTVQRLYQQILLLKSNQIDEKTKEIVTNQGKILMAIDGQKPQRGYPMIWLFTDILSGRLLKTTIAKSMPNQVLHNEIEDILIRFKVKTVGFLSDKQSNLVKCCQTFYPNIPHQFCTMHFCQHLWGHLEMLDNQLYLPISTTINNLYTITKSNDQPVIFEKLGALKVSKVFNSINNDLQRILKKRSKKFKFLKGLWMYRTLEHYLKELQSFIPAMDTGVRLEKIYKKLCKKLHDLIIKLRSTFFEVLFLFDSFRLIYQRIYSECASRFEKQEQLDHIFGVLWAKVRINDPTLSLESLKSVLPSAKNSFYVVLAEWVRLWNSFLPGLFSYYDFPKKVYTNTLQEQAFSQQKGKLRRRLRVENIGYFLQTRGELYLRLVYATKAELESEIVTTYCANLIESLKKPFQQKISEETSSWVRQEINCKGIVKTLKEFHPSYRKLIIKKKKISA